MRIYLIRIVDPINDELLGAKMQKIRDKNLKKLLSKINDFHSSQFIACNMSFAFGALPKMIILQVLQSSYDQPKALEEETTFNKC